MAVGERFLLISTATDAKQLRLTLVASMPKKASSRGYEIAGAKPGDVGVQDGAHCIIGLSRDRELDGSWSIRRKLPVHENQVPSCDCIDNICVADDTHQFAITCDGDTLDFAFSE